MELFIYVLNGRIIKEIIFLFDNKIKNIFNKKCIILFIIKIILLLLFFFN